ncbi:hypothetical protein XENTR_v10014690 [Xenopus tropicalis]|nr:hypothetical protein XENTR_v10014690 [Xenopus tropicalis]KAE8604376.1 hypothetical protein XENTR_v10014690 [Xenopus tropicalis]
MQLRSQSRGEGVLRGRRQAEKEWKMEAQGAPCYRLLCAGKDRDPKPHPSTATQEEKQVSSSRPVITPYLTGLKAQHVTATDWHLI